MSRPVLFAVDNYVGPGRAPQRTWLPRLLDATCSTIASCVHGNERGHRSIAAAVNCLRKLERGVGAR